MYFYSIHTQRELESLLERHQKAFEEMLEDTFDDDELTQFESSLDAIAAVYAQPIMAELTFDDLEAGQEDVKQRFFFENCQSCLSFENVPYLDSNPFQVTYFQDVLSLLDEVLIDRGGFNPLMMKAEFLLELNKYKTISSVIPEVTVPMPVRSTKVPVDPIDFLIRDVYLELDRVMKMGLLTRALERLSEQSEILRKVFFVMREEKLDADALLRKTDLNAKTFDDNLEKLKFYLKKIT